MTIAEPLMDDETFDKIIQSMHVRGQGAGTVVISHEIPNLNSPLGIFNTTKIISPVIVRDGERMYADHTVYEWEVVNEAGHVEVQKRFSHDPMRITVEHPPETEAQEVDYQRVTIHDPTTSTLFAFDLIDEVHAQNFSFNGKSFDRATKRDVPNDIFIGDDGNQMHTESSLVEAFVEQTRGRQDLIFEANDPQAIRDIIKQIGELREQFSALGTGVV